MKDVLLSPDAVDTRTLFRVYGACAALAGLLAFAAPSRLGGLLGSGALADPAVVRFAGSLLVALGIATGGLSEIEDPRSRHRALGYFAFAHLVVLAGAVTLAVSRGGPIQSGFLAPLLIGVCVLLGYFWQTSGGRRLGEGWQITPLFGASELPDDRLRSAYEERIREAASQEERHRLARELHDSVKQQIFAMQAAAATAQARFDLDAVGARDALERLRESGREAMAEMEVMLDSLRSTPLTNAGLVEALKKHGEALQFRTGAQVRFEIGDLPSDPALPPGAQQAIFRVAQEAFANVGRHARATHVTVRLGLEGGALALRIQDDGAGFTPSASLQGMGLANMRERARAFGARLVVRSEAGAGTIVTLWLPCRPSVGDDLSIYRGRVIGWAAGAAVIAAVALLNWLNGWSRVDLAASLSLLVANLVILLRAVGTYRAARRREEGTSWTKSPSPS